MPTTSPSCFVTAPGNRRRAGRRLVGSLLAALAVGWAAPAARADDWGTPGLDAAHSRLSAERSGALFGDGRWRAAPAGRARVLASPAVSDGFAVTVDLNGTVRALDATTGKAVWQASAGSAVQGSPAVARGRVFVPTFGNKVTAFRLENGQPIWSRDIGGTVLSSPTPIEGDVVVAAGFPQRHLVRLSGASGEVVWQSPDVIEQFSNTSPAIGGGLVVVGSNGGHTYAFDLATGAPRWSYAADGIVHLAAPLIAGGNVYLAGGDDSPHVHAVDAATGVALAGWPVALPTPDPDVAGELIGRHRAVSSIAFATGLLLLQTRLDDALDTDADGIVDETLSRELVVALDPVSGALVWQYPLARAERTDPNDVPKFLVCPTPAAFGTTRRGTLVAVASSLDPTAVVLDAATGGVLGRHRLAGAALASPVVANGRLISVATDGTVEGLLSGVNHPPSAPIAAANQRPLDSSAVRLRWSPANDADAELPTYELRIDTDGEVLESWQQQIFLGPGVTSTRVSGRFAAGVAYTFAVRARDGHGAYSPWSRLETFQVAVNPPVTVSGQPARSLDDALAAAQPGDIVGLAAGTYTLSGTVHLAGGVAIQGAGAGRTTLDAAGLAVGVKVDGSAVGKASTIDGLTVAGADICVRVADGSTGVRLNHVIVRDCRTDGVRVAAAGEASVLNATLLRNGTAVSVLGRGAVKNSVLTANGIALRAEQPEALTSSYDDVCDNQTGYQGLSAGPGDFAKSVTFADLAGGDFRLPTGPSTDRGDPADDVGLEPTPNGGRINLGAFGGTADAERSEISMTAGDPIRPPAPLAPAGPEGGNQGGGCTMSGRFPPGHGVIVPVLLGLLLRRGRRVPEKD